MKELRAVKRAKKPDLNSSVENLLDRANLKRTQFRLSLVRFFLDLDAPISAAHIFEQILDYEQLQGLRFDRATLFRNLKTLVDKDILATTEFGEGAAYYFFKSQSHHSHHVFCVKCKVAAPIDYCGVAPMVEKAHQRGYKVLSHRFELLGICPQCLA